MENLANTNTQNQNMEGSNHYKVDTNLNIASHNAERAEFFKVDIKDLAKMLNGTPEEKDDLILALMQENQMLREDNEVIRTIAMKEKCKVSKLEKKLDKAVNS